MKRKAIEIKNINDIRNIQSQMKNANMEVPSSEALNNALEDSKKRSALINECNRNREEKLIKDHHIKPMECHNTICPYNIYDRYSYCNNKDNLYLDCNCRLLQPNPNHLDYDEDYLPTWREALDLLAKNGLIKEDVREECRKASINYGKPATQDERWETEIKGITMAQAEKSIKASITEYFNTIKNNDFYTQEEKDEFANHFDINVIASNCCVDLEKPMGIYPNIQI